MAQQAQIMCINKTNRTSPHERIQNIGGPTANGRWKWTVEKAIQEIEAGNWQFYTHVNGVTAWVIVAVHEGHKYLKTQNDGLHPNNLLALPECP